MVSSHQIRDPEYFADSSNILWNQPTIDYPDRTATADVTSFTLRTAHSAIPLVSDLSGVDVQ